MNTIKNNAFYLHIENMLVCMVHDDELGVLSNGTTRGEWRLRRACDKWSNAAAGAVVPAAPVALAAQAAPVALAQAALAVHASRQTGRLVAQQLLRRRGGQPGALLRRPLGGRQLLLSSCE